MKIEFYSIYLILISLIVNNCSTAELKFTLEKISDLPGIASASGIEETGRGRFVIGDDSPYMFRINDRDEVEEKILLLPNREIPELIFEKKVKPDFEAITKTNNKGEGLFIFGSGSKSPQRDILLEVTLSEIPEIKEYNLSGFYEVLKNSAKITSEDLNIEAAEIFEDHLFLFNRGKNFIARYSLREFKNYLRNKNSIPRPEVYPFLLPKVKGIEAGFSGASIALEAEAFIFTATVEDTANWIDDGEVLGSFLGMMKIKDLENEQGVAWIPILQNDKHLPIKVESVTVVPPFSKNRAELLLVTDSDGGISQILRGNFTFTKQQE